MSHTPGPWEVSRHAKMLIVANNGRGVANAGGPTDTTVADGGEEENIANARLIASAPELLAALKGFLSHEYTVASENLAAGLGKSEDYDLVANTFEAAGAAIAKAEGTK